MRPETYLVTGATGFIGAAIARALADAGHDVHGVGRGGRRAGVGVTRHACDLLDAASVKSLIDHVRPTHLVHCAWDVTHNVYWTSTANFDWLAASVALLKAFQAAGGRRAVGVGTCAEYAASGTILHETASPLVPATPYGRCKLALFHAFEAARLMGLSTAWGRLFFPYGPGDGERRFLPSLARAMRAGEAFDMSSGLQELDFIHIDDVGAFARLAESDVTGPVNIANGEGVALRDVALRAAEALGRDPALLRMGAIAARATDPPSLVADVSRLRDEVGFRPQAPWRQGVARFVAGSDAAQPA
jgi:nucleoside-diphosphate-sugar epimerase